MKDTNLDNNNPFFEAKNLLDGLIDALCSKKWLCADHGAVEQLIHKSGFELLRHVLQGHLDERARQEPDFDIIRHETREHTYDARIALDNLIPYSARWKYVERVIV